MVSFLFFISQQIKAAYSILVQKLFFAILCILNSVSQASGIRPLAVTVGSPAAELIDGSYGFTNNIRKPGCRGSSPVGNCCDSWFLHEVSFILCGDFWL
jgi:hypothetical protein